MPYTIIAFLVGWLAALAIFFGFIILLRFIQYRERMLLLTHGIHPQEYSRQRRNHGILRAGLVTMMVGLTLTIGLYPIGFIVPTYLAVAPFHIGPWLLPGLIPFGVGLALIGSYYLEQNNVTNIEDTTEQKNVVSLKDHQDKERREYL